ncbi:MAG TPA: acyl-CoA dehydrogenase family protein [Anaerohalosphaeraceae bacterium]|nr:acyl-CoA dehydrogenase family protein [Phycisphaerae bacterium]HOK95479.1 acyl-CoA dehydrogenase family protein [Anaerohalosphaeraceae bacterium]HOM75070.1 acyl-CoA dehydrogenase family protein [Anaerohalosphaeraceae bacterium]HPC63175.1 acyl-CoA dehydrogenase family protein [Anaerohalosphaeraceae bacterium]HRS72077.1 acyl-CoA dehydrogenase family protein [Anaerohalosphaeraceae bacterium]
MGNFYTDNDDIQFLFRHLNLAEIAELQEEGFKYAGQYDTAPVDAQEAITNYDLVLRAVGQLSADFIAPRSESIDREGTTLNEDGSVSYAKGIAESLNALAKADVMGFTLPHRFGGLNFPNLIYSMAIEVVSRADASLMNIFGLQGIAETINYFADEEIKQRYLHDFAAGKVTGAMVLTEPDAGSDLQACKLRAFQDDEGQWYLHGVKRFITNGCGEVLLVLARSEPDRSGGLGLSLFVCDRGPTVKVRRLEDKLGIHGSPTCELYFDNTPCQLIGERQRGLVTYVMSLMNGARIGIAGQSMGIAEAAYRVARDYAASRQQFGMPIEKLPAVRDMLIRMKMEIEAGRALLYETSWVVDHEIGWSKIAEAGSDKDKVKEAKQQLKTVKRLAGMLTPMSKYYCSEMCNRITYDAIQILGGSGYMRDYACERYARDARITTIYEGTSQLQIVAAVRGVCGGACEKYLADLSARSYVDSVTDLLALLSDGSQMLLKCVAFTKEQGVEYMDLYGRQLVDMAIALINGYLLCGQASSSVKMLVRTAGGSDAVIPMIQRKEALARRYVTRSAAMIKSLAEEVLSGDRSTFKQYEVLAGPVPEQI